MKWTKEWPKAAGWYWVRQYAPNGNRWDVPEGWCGGRVMECASVHDRIVPVGLMSGWATEWAGPIPEPEATPPGGGGEGVSK